MDSLHIKHTDITHKPKRYQNDIDNGLKPKVINKHLVEVDISSSVPQFVTLEQAISYFSTHAAGEFKALYTRTAEWLTEFRDLIKEKPKGDETENDDPKTDIEDVPEGEEGENDEGI